MASVLFHATVTLGELIRDARVRRGWTQAELAARLGVQQQAVTRWESEKDRPRPETVRSIARELNLSGTEVAAALGYIDPAEPQEGSGLRLPAGVKLSDLQPHEQRALETIVDAFIDSVRREAP